MGYTFLVVDDEGIERMALSQIIRREFPGDVSVHTLPNGMEMLRFLENQKADVAIVDIDMPGVSGIETIRKLRQRGDPIRIIINTAYSNFQYAVDAIRLDVDDYLVKPLRREKLIEALRSCVEKLEAQRQQAGKEKEILRNLKPAIASSFLRLVEKDGVSQQEWDPYLSAMGIQPERMVIACLDIPGWAEIDTNLQQKVLAQITGMLSIEYDCIVGSQPESGVTAMMVCQKDQYRRAIYEKLQKALEELCATVDAMTHRAARVGVGAVVEGVLQLHTSYRQAREALRGENGDKVSFFDYLPPANRRLSSVEERNTASKPVREACLIVKSHYREEISLDSVAERVKVTPSYLSRLFKKEIGINFQDYLTDVRMEKAVELLRDESLSVRALSKAVGYNNHTYFCKIFKRETGKTVGEYRESLGMKNQEQEE